jgi:elongation factor P
MPISIEIPKSVILKIVYAEHAVKGDSSNNPTKMAELESGIKIQVPLFINTGDLVKVNTESGTYSERVNS